MKPILIAIFIYLTLFLEFIMEDHARSFIQPNTNSDLGQKDRFKKEKVSI